MVLAAGFRVDQFKLVIGIDIVVITSELGVVVGARIDERQFRLCQLHAGLMPKVRRPEDAGGNLGRAIETEARLEADLVSLEHQCRHKRAIRL